MLRHVVLRRFLLRHHVGVEVGRTPDGLAGVVDDEVEPRSAGKQLATERFDARRVPQIETEDLEAILPLLEVRLLGVALGGIAWEPRGHDELRAAPQQLQPRLVSDLHARTSRQRHAAAQIGQLRAFPEVQLRARRAQLIVEMMDGRIGLLADVTVLRLTRLLHRRLLVRRRNVEWLKGLRRKHVGRRHHRTAAQCTNAGLIEHGVVLARALGLSSAGQRLDLKTPCRRIGIADVRERTMQPFPFVRSQVVEQMTIARTRLQQFEELAQAFGERDRTSGHAGQVSEYRMPGCFARSSAVARWAEGGHLRATRYGAQGSRGLHKNQPAVAARSWANGSTTASIAARSGVASASRRGISQPAAPSSRPVRQAA